MRCNPVDRRWHRALLFTRARMDIYSLGEGKVSYVSYDGNKQPGQQHGCVHLSLPVAGGCLRGWSGAPAVPEHLPPWPGAGAGLSPDISHLGLGLPLRPRPAGKALLTRRVADNASVLEMLSCEATEEIYYLQAEG